ncbi:MAG TPA: 2-C-methyl-D-erythritol 2,4-cyclodiphosphate synthase [Gemmatimonadaceae bacterium]|nr:2-C-methyl-D-erythritol 2,4-cyclodiphosphate synthase [Gemmatimonadaceae bacterium]
MSVRFDSAARKAIERAMIEAETRRHATLDTGHLLLGVIAAEESPAAGALRTLGVDVRRLHDATVRLLEAEFASGPLALEISPATDDALLRAYQHSLERDAAEVSDLDILFACAQDAATTAGMALEDVGVSAGRLTALLPRRAGAVAAAPGHQAAADESAEVAAAAFGTVRPDGLLGAPTTDGGQRRRVSSPQHIMFGGAPTLPGASRSGIGYDSHRFEPGGPLLLGGVAIPSEVRLVGHSDGDAVAHAVTDAVLGAAAAGDIGEMFSDTDPANSGRDSIEMLRAAVERVRAVGFVVQQVDVTVIAEQPKIAPHRGEMRERLAAALGVAPEAVSVKGKTNEGMGWIGRGEGLACIAVATLVAALGAD